MPPPGSENLSLQHAAAAINDIFDTPRLEGTPPRLEGDRSESISDAGVANGYRDSVIPMPTMSILSLNAAAQPNSDKKASAGGSADGEGPREAVKGAPATLASLTAPASHRQATGSPSALPAPYPSRLSLD